MFRKLRRQLIVINLVIIAVLFLILTAGTYFLAKNDLTKHREGALQRIAAEVNSGAIKDLSHRDRHGPFGPGGPGGPPESGSAAGPPGPHDFTGPPGPPGPSLFFVKTDAVGTVTFQSSDQPLESAHLALLVRQTLSQGGTTGTIIFEQSDFSYYKTPRQDGPGMLLVFEDIHQQENLLRTLVLALIATGLVCLILSLLASVYMANRALIPVRQAWQQQKDFLADASHELRTPLAVIQTNLEIVMSSQEETVASQDKWLSNIRDESDHMAKLVNSLLFLARADSQQQPLAKELFDLDRTAAGAAEPFVGLAAAKGLAFNILVDTEVTIRGDEDRIRQVIGILLDNAIRHTPPGGTVSLQVARSDNKAVMTVADTGDGIPSAHLAKIFDRFYQVDSSRGKGGAGLGLAIAKWIVQQHGGRIEAVSPPGSGARFTVELPLP
ncbi:MAG: ATP-binding protein [Negativicutes bacterium]|nr:ATP-binding protein [Negativicutes bacterium]